MTTDNIPHSVSGATAIQIARGAALAAGKVLLDRFHQPKQVSFKSPGNIVTDVDRKIERQILSTLSEQFPATGLLGEESFGGKRDNGLTWVVDPIDGTRNYASGIPFYSVVIGLALDGEPLCGVTYDPVRDEMFHAERGKGAFLNDQRITISEKTALSDSVFGTDLSYNIDGAANSLGVVRHVWPNMQTVRIMGSAALGICYVAAGRTDLFFHHQLEPWDQITGLLLVEEAGGLATDRTGKRAQLYSDGLIATSHTLHGLFMRATEGLPWREPTSGLT